MVSFNHYWGFKGIGIIFGGDKEFGHSIDIYLLFLTLTFDFNDGRYGNRDGK